MYREEHPNPQFLRNEWINLNGEWDFDLDLSKTGIERRVFEKDSLPKKIEVPFCPESSLSKVEYKDFIDAVWYMKKFTLPESWTKSGKVFIHFGAVDFSSVLYINKKEAGRHTGGYTHFKFDITDFINEGENTIALYVEDDTRSGFQPSGKQSDRFASYGCFYTRTTGIWQTVYLEHTPDKYIESFELFPDAKNGAVTFKVRTKGEGELKIKAEYEGKSEGETAILSDGFVTCTLQLSEKYLWELGNGRLYNLTLTFGEDEVKSYFGLRDVRMDGKRFLLNGKSVFQRLVLDQGFYPDGIYTAKSEEDMIKDIKLSMDAGFNGARLHEKVFEPRFLYHCDKMGYMVWGEYPNWGFDHTDITYLYEFAKEWREALLYSINHPSIIGWCPFNETWDRDGRRQSDEMIKEIYYMTKALDPTRPVIDSSGVYHTVTDIYDIHDYEQDPEAFASHYKETAEGKVIDTLAGGRQEYRGGPLFVSEYGGIGLCIKDGWSYGQSAADVDEYLNRYEKLTKTLLDNPDIMGFCYTQLYDVEQEVNGIYTYERQPKCDIARIKAINESPAAIEKN